MVEVVIALAAFINAINIALLYRRINKAEERVNALAQGSKPQGVREEGRKPAPDDKKGVLTDSGVRRKPGQHWHQGLWGEFPPYESKHCAALPVWGECSYEWKEDDDPYGRADPVRD